MVESNIGLLIGVYDLLHDDGLWRGGEVGNALHIVVPKFEV